MRSQNCQRAKRRRQGTSLTEIVVAGSLLVTAMSLVVQGTYSLRKLERSGREFQLASDELSNQLERLVSMQRSDLNLELTKLQPSQLVESNLPDVMLTGALISDAMGDRIRVEIDWRRAGDPPALSLTAWLAEAVDEPPTTLDGGAAS